MSKFKVGDKVRGTKSGYAYTNEKMTLGVVEWVSDGSAIGVKILEHEEYDRDTVFTVTDNCFELVVEQPRREFIVIRRSGAETIAELRHDREVIKSAKATCAPSDTFDLDTGAKLAFDRLMEQEEPKPAPEPPKFYTGKVFAVKTLKHENDHQIAGRVGRVFEFKNGVAQFDLEKYGMGINVYRYASFADICAIAFATEWREVKEPSDV